MADAPLLTLSHYQLRVEDLARMEDFYTRVLGFLVTDRGKPGPGQMVFMSRNPGEHHQLVLVQVSDVPPGPAAVDHLAFRVAGLAALRRFHAALSGEAGTAIETVSHGTSWSIYFRDPEDNRVEVFVDTPWHVDQPVRFTVDLTLPDLELARWTEDQIRDRTGFRPAEAWRAEFTRRLAGR